MSSPRPYSRFRLPLLLGVLIACFTALAYLLRDLLGDVAWIGWVSSLAAIAVIGTIGIRRMFAKIAAQERDNRDALIDLNAGRYEQARRAFEHIIGRTHARHRTRLAALHYNASVATLRSGNIEEALRQLARLSSVWLDHPHFKAVAPGLAAHHVMALALLGRLDDAKKLLSSCEA